MGPLIIKKKETSMDSFDAKNQLVGLPWWRSG